MKLHIQMFTCELCLKGVEQKEAIIKREQLANLRLTNIAIEKPNNTRPKPIIVFSLIKNKCAILHDLKGNNESSPGYW